MFKQSITIYNRYKNPVTKMDNFKRTVLNNTHWESTQGVTVGGINLTTSNSISVVIPLSTDGYTDPSNYNGEGWTLSENDYIVKGKVDKEITSYADLKEFDMKMVISSYEVNDYARIKRLNNYKAVGK